jgi:hypothetical protein
MEKPITAESTSTLIDAKIDELGDWRAIDIHEPGKINDAALKDLIRAAVTLNLKAKSKPTSSKRSS